MTFAPPPTLPLEPSSANPEAVASPYVAQALKRLRQMANGNGIDPEALRLVDVAEAHYQLKGIISFKPVIDQQQKRYSGPVRGHKTIALPSIPALRETIRQRGEAFAQGSDWLEEARHFLSTQSGAGFGHDDLRIDLPERTVILAACRACPTCAGNQLLTCPQCESRGQVTCTHCQGQRQEVCPTCLGRGKNPTQPDQPCPTCNGQGRVACRYCNASGYLVCPTCRGKRGIPCNTCAGSGKLTTEVTMSFALRTRFRLTGEGLPSGLRRGLDRLGLRNLGNGHATISMVDDQPANIEETEPETEQEAAPPAPDPYAAHWGDDSNVPAVATPPAHEEEEPSAHKPEIHYLADMPYADLHMNMAGKKCIIHLFGLRGALLSVPAFLDEALEPALQTLRQSAKGKARIEAALGFRLMRDALQLQLQNKGTPQELRKLYPLGLSPDMGRNILQAMRQSLNRLTLHIRSAVAAGGVLLSGGLFASVFDTGLHGQITHTWPTSFTAAFDIALLIAASLGGRVALSAATHLWLRKRFPDAKVPTLQPTGKTGYAMIGGIVALFIISLAVALQKPVWMFFK